MNEVVCEDSQVASVVDSSGYKGDSIGKKIARVYLWKRIVSSLRERRLDGGSIAFLASRDGGDAAALTALGWPPNQLLAIDRDAGALAESSRKHPDVPTVHGDAASVVTGRQEKFSAIYLDFCSPGTNEALDTIAKCVPRVRHMGRLAYCVMRGRERGAKSTNFRLVGEDTKAVRDKASFSVFGDPPEVMNDLLHPRVHEARARITDGRCDLFEEYVQKKMTPHRIELRYVTFVAYQSATSDNRGVPMMIDDWEIDHMGKGISIDRFRKMCRKASAEMIMRRSAQLLEIDRRDRSSGIIECRIPGLDDVVRVVRCNLDLHGANTGNLVELSHQLESDGVDAAKALGVQAGTLAAYRAHHTQGRYESAHLVMS